MKLAPCRLCGREVLLRGYRAKVKKGGALVNHIVNIVTCLVPE